MSRGDSTEREHEPTVRCRSGTPARLKLRPAIAAWGIGGLLVAVGLARSDLRSGSLTAAERPSVSVGSRVDARIQGQESGKSAGNGVYSEAQADRGSRLFETRCGTCHQVAEFADPHFMGAWKGQPAAGLFEMIRAAMPEDNPGSLTRQQYADILAFIFKKNGLPAGEAELKGTPEALKEVIIEVVSKPAAGKAPSSGAAPPEL